MENLEPTPEADPQLAKPAPAAPAWQEIEKGRFRPRRIRGSCVGRDLG
jgi:hypothetical protein